MRALAEGTTIVRPRGLGLAMACAALGLLLVRSDAVASDDDPKPAIGDVLLVRELAGAYLVRIDAGQLVRIPWWLPGGNVTCFSVYEATVLERLGGEEIPSRVRFSASRALAIGGEYVITLRGGVDLRGVPPALDQILDSPSESPPYCVRRVRGVFLSEPDILEVVRDDIEMYGYVIVSWVVFGPTDGVVDVDRGERGVLLDDLSRSLGSQNEERWVPLEAKSRAALR